MPVLTDEEYLTLLKGECGIEGDTSAISLLNIYWKRFSSFNDKERRFLETKAGILRYLQGKLKDAMKVKIGPDTLDLEARYNHVVDMLNDTLGQLGRLTGASGPGKVSTSRPSAVIPGPTCYVTYNPKSDK